MNVKPVLTQEYIVMESSLLMAHKVYARCIIKINSGSPSVGRYLGEVCLVNMSKYMLCQMGVCDFRWHASQ